eukprot:TRINITY_DN23590_c0_g1_i1.p1 TRINITY_DN23590_c0_g1~~TRINITY_DN23590_c0_g1_i1.p1  ORF type:complete len:601 (+),score=113.36 TRINITY_DN23590_c0_g1_i1:238-1803(+)
MNVVGFGKDLYLLEFGANARTIGSIMLVLSFISPVMDALGGTLQDRGSLLWRCFPVATWGRRAPWYLTHHVFMALLVLAFFLPPSYDRTVLHIWFAAIWTLGFWCVSVSVNAFEAARVEIYPFKEERILLEQYCKFTVAVGGAIGSGVASVCLTAPTTYSLLAASCACSLAVLSGVVATPVLREARKERIEAKQSCDLQKAFSSALSLDPLVIRMLLLRALQGSYETIMPALQLYYYTFVYQLDKTQRLFWFLVGGMVMGFVELSVAPLWSRLFARSTKLMLYLPTVLRVVDAIAVPFFLMTNRRVEVFICYLGFWRFCNSGYTYWRVAAAAWICDQDTGDRKGMLLGIFSMVTSLGRAVTGASVILGMSAAGLATTNCLADEGIDLEQCEHDKIFGQPESLRTYLVVMLAFVSPVLSLAISALTLEFPIRPGSELLAKLCEQQAVACGQLEVISAVAPALPPATISDKAIVEYVADQAAANPATTVSTKGIAECSADQAPSTPSEIMSGEIVGSPMLKAI